MKPTIEDIEEDPNDEPMSEEDINELADWFGMTRAELEALVSDPDEDFPGDSHTLSAAGDVSLDKAPVHFGRLRDMMNMTTSSGLTADQISSFMRLCSALSPENLHCDGEISRTAAKRREAQLRREWKQLERSVGRTVTEDEVWSAFLANRR